MSKPASSIYLNYQTKTELYRGNNYYDNTSHYCFGRQIIAPGDGVVIDAKDGVPDNVVEFSMLAHFMNGSVQVQKGEKVRTGGTPLGKCGNSGNSNLPHLH